MKYLKSCLPKGTLLDTTILLISGLNIEIDFSCWWNSCPSISESSNFIIFYTFLYMVLFAFIFFFNL